MTPRSKKAWVILLSYLGEATLASNAYAQYVVGDIMISQRIPNPTSQGYACVPSDDFPGVTRCERRKSSRGASGSFVETSVILHTADSTALYTMSYAAPVSINSATAKAELDELSSKLGRSPTNIKWHVDEEENPIAVVAHWGEVRLDELGREGREALLEGKSARQGVLVDLFGDLTRSAKDEEPIYRLVGGLGVVYTAQLGQVSGGFRRIAGIDAAALLAKKYEAELQIIFQRDRLLDEKDYSLWPEVAEKTRRLALDTSVSVADSTQDRVVKKYPSKLASHLWARLPSSVIQGLTAHEYRPGVDHYGPKSKFPAIRAELQNFVQTEPSDTFIEFAQYALGDPAAGLRERPASVIRDVMHYSIAYRILRKLARDTIVAAQFPKGFTTVANVWRSLTAILRYSTIGSSPRSSIALQCRRAWQDRTFCRCYTSGH
jgi:hypothetical protein